MRTLIVSRIFYSGQTTHVVELAKGIVRTGRRAALITAGRCHLGAWEAYRAELEAAGVPAWRAASEEEALAWGEAFRPDVIHCHSSDMLRLALRLRETAGAPAVVTCHGLGVPRAAPELARADAVIAVGAEVAKELVRSGIPDPVIIGNGVDTQRFAPGPKPGALQVAYVGRLDAAKRPGLAALIEAVEAIPRARLVVAANDRPRSPRVEALGWVIDVAPLLSRSHVVAGTGRAVREGMAAGCIGLVLGKRYAGVVRPETIERFGAPLPSFSGAWGDPPDARAIRADLIRATQDPAARRSLARWSREFSCRHCSLERMVDDVLALYDKALRREPSWV